MYSVDELVEVSQLPVYEDSGGMSYDTIRSDDEAFLMFGQDRIFRPRFGSVRAFRYHQFTKQYFTVLSGAAIFWFVALPVLRDGYDDDEVVPDIEVVLNNARQCYRAGWEREFDTYDNVFGYYGDRPWYMSVVANGERPVCIDVPAGVAYGWSALDNSTTILATSSEPYCADDPDECRFQWDMFGAHIWTIENK